MVQEQEEWHRVSDGPRCPLWLFGRYVRRLLALRREGKPITWQVRAAADVLGVRGACGVAVAGCR